MSLSAIIHTKNAAATLEAALESVVFADEIIVVDMESTDQTPELARSHGAKVVIFPDRGFADPARNFGLSQAKYDWVLVLDADEEISLSLRQEIQRIVAGQGDTTDQSEIADVYYLPRKNLIFNRWLQHTGWWPDYQIRLFKRGSVSWSDRVHELPKVTGTSRQLPALEELAIIHHNYASLEAYLERLDRYTTIKAREINSQPEQPTLSSAVLFDVFGQEFIRRLFAQEGLKDGPQGVSLSLLQSMYELVVRLKVWQHTGFPQVQEDPTELIDHISAWERQLRYWVADWHYQQASGLGRIYWRIRRKARI